MGVDAERVFVLRSETESYYNQRKVAADDSGFVHFVGLVKAVCKTDHEGTNSNRFWSRLEPEISKSEYKIRKDIVYISYKAVDKLVKMHSSSCKKTWGVFLNDGLGALVRDMKKKRGAPMPSPSSGEPTASNKKGKSQVAAEEDASAGGGLVFNNKEEFMKARRLLIFEREKNLNKLETTLIDRVAVLNKRESLCAAKEETLAEKEEELKELETRLVKKEREMERPDVSQFLSQVSSLANKFKAKAARSRRNSSEERRAGSITPNDSDVTSPAKSPTPIPSSDSDDDDDDDDDDGDEDDTEQQVSLFGTTYINIVA